METEAQEMRPKHLLRMMSRMMVLKMVLMMMEKGVRKNLKRNLRKMTVYLMTALRVWTVLKANPQIRTMRLSLAPASTFLTMMMSLVRKLARVWCHRPQ